MGKIAAFGVLATVVACGTQRPRDDAGSAGGLTGIDGSAETGDGGLDDDGDDGTAGDGSSLDDSGGGADGQADEGCATLVEPATNSPQPADIIVVVDNSGSMSFEALSVQANLNGFSQQIVDSGIDAHVVLMSRYPGNGNGPNGEETGICVDPPLGGGGCPNDDDNLPTFDHIGDTISSNDALSKILEHEDDWRAHLRPDAALHFVVISDDESEIDAATFDAGLLALDAAYDGYKLHGVVCTSSCPEAEAIGQVYISLGTMTGGITADLCDQDFAPVFDDLATEVIAGATIACAWTLPAPPPGETLDPDEVNVTFDDGQGGGFDIGRVESAADCAGVGDGWYYDDPTTPTTIHACPQTCDQIQGVETATIQVTLGCATIPAG
jgi:hypothetical protein